MTKLEQIKSTIETLSPEEVRRLGEWLEDLEGRLFDDTIERDAKSGKLDHVLEKVRANMRSDRGEDF